MREIYTTSRGTRIALGDRFQDVARADARTLLVVAIGEPYADWKGVRRCPIDYRIVAQVGKAKCSAAVKTIDAERLADRKLFARIASGGGGEA
ncbi:hypothetical protein BJY24_007887 [Nocardia transvalensis]|uniref:Uncharacterized protein n=1 Tax=Nocardia transvalensis TaxID=37333 RepID=A0A7W9PML9_9NOCA|nr:hypothetical protein [Nocardia transvalensis]MBB5918954.1 hypothetical protein [Nocardia transvalensis]